MSKIKIHLNYSNDKYEHIFNNDIRYLIYIQELSSTRLSSIKHYIDYSTLNKLKYIFTHFSKTN